METAARRSWTTSLRASATQLYIADLNRQVALEARQRRRAASGDERPHENNRRHDHDDVLIWRSDHAKYLFSLSLALGDATIKTTSIRSPPTVVAEHSASHAITVHPSSAERHL